MGPPGHMSPSSFQVSTKGPDLAFLRKVHLGCFGSLLVSCWCTAQRGIEVDSGRGPRVASSRSLACAPGGAASPCCSVCTRLTSTPHTVVIQWAASPSWPESRSLSHSRLQPCPQDCPACMIEGLASVCLGCPNRGPQPGAGGLNLAQFWGLQIRG